VAILKPLQTGELAPWFVCRTSANAQYHFDTVAGRYVALCFFRSAADAISREVLDAVTANRACFDDENTTFYGVSEDAEDERQQRVADLVPGMRFFWDPEGRIRAAFGLGATPELKGHKVTYVLDLALRVIDAIPFGADGKDHVARLLAKLASLPPPGTLRTPAPVLEVPAVFEPELCASLIAYYAAQGGGDSGFMREVDGRTVGVINYAHKRRRDCEIKDAAVRAACMQRIESRLVPQIERAFQFRAMYMERYIISCYDAAEGAHFKRHRDNTTKGTAHRKFAVSLFLNTGEYEGGYLWFPEFGPRRYEAPAGGAVVFSCSMLHEATRVTRGKRFMFLPFLYDEAGGAVRSENRKFIGAEEPADAPESRSDVFVFK
jgi:predicted 2-oxoglutarate/Fe(II)-dependent dioxygenase YbiX/peroxiredoxin